MIDPSDLEDEQRQARDALNRNVTLDAGAGTGKTTTLTARYMNILEQEVGTIEGTWIAGEIDRETAIEHAASIPRRIVTTTFTERAAADLTAKVRDEVNAKLTAVRDTRTYELWRAVGDALEEGYVHTLHALCSRLLQEHAVGSTRPLSVEDDHVLARYGTTYDDLEPGFDVYEEDDAERLVREAVAATLREHEQSDAVRTLARRWDRGSLEDVLYDFLTTSPRSDPFRWLDWFSTISSEEEYLHEVLSLFAPRAETSAVWTDIRPDLERVLELRDEGASRPTNTVIEPLVTVVDEYGFSDTSSFDRAARLDRVAFLLECANAVRDGDGELYDESYLFPKAYHETDGIETDEHELYAATWRIATRVPDRWAEVSPASLDGERLSFPYVSALAEIAELAFEKLAAEKRRRGVVDFGDLILLTRHFLESLDPAERAEIGFLSSVAEDGTSRPNAYVMVDEFQDTNFDQWAIVNALTSSDLETPNATNVFVVGDDKQSIYRFRGADVSVFSTAKEQLKTANEIAGVHEEQSRLKTNFRTIPEPLRAINGLFDRIFPGVDAAPDPDGRGDLWYEVEDGDPAPYEARSEPLVSARQNRTGDGERIEPVIEYLPVPVDRELRAALLGTDHDLVERRTTNADALEAQAVVNRLAKLLTDGTRVYEEVDEEDDDFEALDRDDGTPVERPRSVRPGDVAILLSSRSALDEYERALRDSGIPYTVIKGSGFYETPEVTALVNLLRVLVDPEDDRALYALLRSPMFGCTDDELARLASRLDRRDSSLWEALSSAEDDRWHSIAIDIERFRSYAGTKDGERSSVHSWGDLVSRILDETGFLTSVSADERGTKAVANVDEFRDRLRSLSEDGVHSLAEVLDRIERRVESDTHDPEANEITFEGTTEDGSPEGSVSVLTIHEAKGMEYEVVVVPGLARQFSRAGKPALGDTFEFETVPVGDGGRQPVLGINGPDPNDPYTDMNTLSKELASRQRTAEERAEAKRLLYVATTRARDHLILSGQHKYVDGDYPFGLEAPDPTEAKSWRDWVQAVLFDDEDARDDGYEGASSALQTLVDSGRFTRTLDYEIDGSVETGTFTVATPPERHEYDPDVQHVDLDLDELDLEAAESTHDRVLRISPHQFTALERGSAKLVWDGGSLRVESANTEFDGASTHQTDVPGNLPAQIFGTVVHRLCEVRPPRSAADQFVRQVVAEERTRGYEIPDSVDYEQVAASAIERSDAARDRIDEFLTEESVLARYDEYPISVTMENPLGVDLDRIEIRGEIDHLVVTDDSYYLFDYKTDRHRGRASAETFVSDRVDHHTPQMVAYSTALQVADPDRDVHVQLVFTECGSRIGKLDDADSTREMLIDLLQPHIPESI